MGYKVVVCGATGNVGREMLNILAERQFPADEVVALASRKSMGSEVSYGDKTLKTKDLDTFDFTGYDIAFFAVGSDATKKYAPKAAEQGCVVIDNSSLYRYDPDVPLVVPEVNPEAVEGYTKKNIIANPNCSDPRLFQEKHHREPELFDRADGCRAEAAARPRQDQTRRCVDLPVRVRFRQRSDGRTVGSDQGRLQPDS